MSQILGQKCFSSRVIQLLGTQSPSVKSSAEDKEHFTNPVTPDKCLE